MIKKVCNICNKEFLGRKESICCSVSCASKHRSNTMKGLVHKPFVDKQGICLSCGKVFDKKRKEVVTCSPKCAHSLQGFKITGCNNGNYNTTLFSRCCDYCGKTFRLQLSQIKRGTGKYCSTNCCDKAKIKPKTLVICATCGKQFYRNRWKVDTTTKMYCSRVCYSKHYNLRSYKVDLMVNYLKELSFNVIEEQTFSWLKTLSGYNLYLDIFLPQINVAIEYDGEHHFRKYFKNDTEEIINNRQILDRLKDKLCLENNIKLIRFNCFEPFNKDYFINKLKLMV